MLKLLKWAYGLLKTLAKEHVYTPMISTYYLLTATRAAGKSLNRKVIAVDSNGICTGQVVLLST